MIIHNQPSKYTQIKTLAKSQGGTFRLKQATNEGIHPEYVRLMERRGELQKISHGTYVLTEVAVSEHQTAIEACTRVPRGVICLLSALQFHGLTTQLPYQVWLALPRPITIPKVDGIPIRFVTYSQVSYKSGIEVHSIRGAELQVYNVAKTVADCFKFRNKVGTDVAIEALRDSWRQKKLKIDDLEIYAKQCRVWNVMKPYTETIVNE